MAFKPDLITKDHILKALEEIDASDEKLNKSTRFDLAVNGKLYPPKEVLRRAHFFATGEHLWERPGGGPTNTFLQNFGFLIQGKSEDQSPFFELIKRYKELLSKERLSDEMYKWELLKQFQGRPDMNAPDLYTEIKSVKFMNLIYGPGIGVIFNLAQKQTEPYRECLKQLFEDGTELTERIRNFSQTAFKLYREIDQQPNHLPHHDERTAATLLTYHDPSKYTFYKDSFYQILCRITGEPPAEPGLKYVHYLRIVSDFIDGFVSGDAELQNLVRKLKSPNCYTDENNMILAQDILYRMLEINGRTFKGLMEELAQTLSDETEPPLFSIMQEISGRQGQRDWMWASDESKLLGSKLAHYEFEILAGKRDKVNICLHFEDELNKKVFWEKIGKTLPAGLEWFPWQHANCIRLAEPVNFFGEQTITNLIDRLKFFDQAIGDQVRNIVKEIKTNELKQKIRMSQPLNQILYGPPGTGKTYHTINKALSIIDGDIEGLTRSALKARYDRYVDEKRIVFTTFHQSLGYEDFIEGIKPLEPAQNAASLQYEIKPGIFKLICNAARLTADVKTQKVHDLANVRFYKMSLGGLQNPHIHDWCIKNNCICLGWGGDHDFADFKKITLWREYRNKFQKDLPDLVKDSRYNITAMFTFQNMRQGDIVVVSKGNNIVDAVGRVTSDYYWSDENDFEYYQFRKVEWLAVNLNQTPETFFRKKISQQSIYEFFDEDIKHDAFTDLFQPAKQDHKPYVLIIDEINRGNVSRVFGELITLLEPDKRTGNSEALKVTLPYSRDEFGVPSNLYVIGTMNTADRSVEALDSALRRRFNFLEMQPHPELLSPERMFWQMLWDYGDSDWADNDYLVAERNLMELFGVTDELKSSLKRICDSWGNIQDEAQIDELKHEYFTGIDLQKLLTVINQRLELLKDRDHLIGHAYLISVGSVEDLMSRFRNNIIPLLQEYFFGDYRKLRLVLGEGFISHTVKKASFAYRDDEEMDSKDLFAINEHAFATKENFMAAYAKINIG
ncbi:AAA family ATPase [Mucilaginibacter sp.]|uniref:AAA family ATPase n=1 Tax=Mucilaginibacter sp. TaxID=1882438 RepID=UPI0025E7EE45|nr:AAA family ATPase [Mucilaginibacter sp.]